MRKVTVDLSERGKRNRGREISINGGVYGEKGAEFGGRGAGGANTF